MAAAAAQPGADGAPAEAAAEAGGVVKLAKLGAAITLGLVLLAIPAALVAVELMRYGAYTAEEDMAEELFAAGSVGASPPPSCGESMAEPSCGEPL